MALQDIYRSHPRLLVAALAVFVAAIVVVIVVTVSGGSRAPQPSGQAPSRGPRSGTPTAGTVTVPDPNYHPSYAKHVPTSPIDQRYASEVDASGQAVAAVEVVNP